MIHKSLAIRILSNTSTLDVTQIHLLSKISKTILKIVICDVTFCFFILIFALEIKSYSLPNFPSFFISKTVTMNRITTYTIIPIFLFLLISNTSNAQDIHLSHIHASPTVLNPAMNGLFLGQARVIANTRSQWNSITKGYKTVIGSADMKLALVNKNDFISGGIQLFADQAGDLNFTTSSAALSFSYLKAFDKRGRNFVSIGIQNAFTGTRVDYSKVKSPNDIPLLTKNNIPNQNSYWDINGGIGWFYMPNKYNSYYLGFSAFHLNKPEVGFVDSETSENAITLYRRFNFHGGATIRVSRELTLKPSFIFMDQGPHREITVGSFFRYKTYRRGLHKKPLYYIYLGGWLRSYLENDKAGIDAFVASMKYEYRKLSLAISYDVNISSYRLASLGRGGIELSLIRVFDWQRPKKKSRKVKCPIL